MPFPFYDVSSPSPSTKNSITRTATDFGYRDFLLLKNIGPQYPNALNIGPSTVRIGEPVLETSINGDTNVIPFGLPLETEGLFRYDIAVLPNRFKNDNPNAPSLTNIEDITQTQGIFGQVDFPQGTQSYPTSPTQQITELGLFGKTEFAQFRKQNTLYNLYLDTTQQTDVSDLISLQPIGASQQINGYLNEYGALNLGGGGGTTQIADILGSVINGQGIGFSNTGIVTNFDIRSSLAGTILGATGVINDTRLGSIGAQQLALALANNAAFNVQEELLGSLNISENILSLVKDGNLAGFRPNYQITVPTPGLGRIADYTARILGFTLPKSYLSDDGSIFQSENGDVANIDRANSMILNTGRGQIKSLITNVIANSAVNGSNNPFRSGYAPGYKDNNGEDAVTSADTKLYAFSTDNNKNVIKFWNKGETIPEISYRREQMVSEYGFKSPDDLYLEQHFYNNIKTPTFSWVSKEGGLTNSTENGGVFTTGTKKSLLEKTQKLFNSKGMLNIVSNKGDMNVNLPSQISSVNGNGTSKGSAVISKERFLPDGRYDGIADTADNTYCRSWTTYNRYDQVSKLIRHRGLERNYPYRNQMEGSVLDDNGFVKITPYSDDNATDPKKYMFSIENLAWSDSESLANLLECEKGPGDLTTGKKGRIMWFPPYNISINESSNVNWESTNFIGRGEPVYTYNNTERSGTLSFSIIVDHPSYVNSFRGPNGPDDNYVASFFAGCVDPSELFVNKLITVSQKDEMQTKTNIIEQQKVTTPEQEPPPFIVYFPNDEDDITSITTTGYENGKMNRSLTPTQAIDYSQNPDGNGFGIGEYVGGVTSQTPWVDTNNFGLNALPGGLIELPNSEILENWTDPNFLPKLNLYLEQYCPSCVMTITSYASPQGTKDANKKLADGRTKSLITLLKANLYSGKSDDYKKARIKENPKGNVPIQNSQCEKPSGSVTDSEACKRDRKSVVTFKFDPDLQAENTAQPDPIVQTTNFNVNTKITNRFYTECSYFEKLTQTNKFVFDSFRDKIKYFHPAFHSTTPEGLNSRLTFLQQCTRQGPTNEKQGASNLAFGRPPVCILRFGDFFHTKVVFDSVSIDYEPFVLDLNPEGVGVQPMMANVTLSFKFLGGSSLLGPINKLQNALSFNYYANTQVYDPRADYLAERTFVDNNPNDGSTIGMRQAENDGKYDIVDGLKNIQEFVTETIETEIKPLEINQLAAADKAVGATQPQPASQLPSTGTTCGYSNAEIIKCLSINSVKYAKDNVLGDYDIYITLAFVPHVGIDNLELKDILRANIYLKSDIGKNKIAFGELTIYQNGNCSDTVIVETNEIDSRSSSDNELVYSKQGNPYNNTIPRDNIQLRFAIDDEKVIKFIDEALTKPSPTLSIEWKESGNPKHNCAFPYP
jgi:hypothetical protein